MVAGVSDVRQMDALLTTTIEHIIPGYREQIFDSTPLLSWINGRLRKATRGGSPRIMVQGGERIRTQVMFEQNSTVKSYSGGETLDTTLQEGMTTLFSPWKQYAGTVGITGLEELSNSGKEAIVDLLEAKMDQLKLTMSDTMSVDAWGDGTANVSKVLTGLQAHVSTTATTMGINPATYLWWKAQVQTTSSAFSVDGLRLVKKVYNDCTRGNRKPEVAFTTQPVYEAYENSLQSQQRITSTRTVDAGFENLVMKGRPVIFDRDAPAGWWTWLNSDAIKLVISSKRNFKLTPFVSPENQDVRSAKLLWAGNIICKERRLIGGVTGFTDS